MSLDGALQPSDSSTGGMAELRMQVPSLLLNPHVAIWQLATDSPWLAGRMTRLSSTAPHPVLLSEQAEHLSPTVEAWEGGRFR